MNNTLVNEKSEDLENITDSYISQLKDSGYKELWEHNPDLYETYLQSALAGPINCLSHSILVKEDESKDSFDIYIQKNYFSKDNMDKDAHVSLDTEELEPFLYNARKHMKKNQGLGTTTFLSLIGGVLSGGTALGYTIYPIIDKLEKFANANPGPVGEWGSSLGFLGGFIGIGVGVSALVAIGLYSSIEGIRTLKNRNADKVYKDQYLDKITFGEKALEKAII